MSRSPQRFAALLVTVGKIWLKVKGMKRKDLPAGRGDWVGEMGVLLTSPAPTAQ